MSEIIIDKNAYLHNLTQISNKVGDKEKVIAVLKDNAYGHGTSLMAKLASEFGIKWACVKSIKEAEEISSFFENLIVLSHIPTGDENPKFIYGINDISNLLNLKKGLKVHLAIDTMMHRNGLKLDELQNAFEIAKKMDLKICGAYTHFRSSDELSGEYFVQKENFEIAKARLRELFDKFNLPKGVFHSHNSAALERATGFGDELVRVGIAQFGYAQFNDSLNLKKVLSLWAHRVSKRVLAKGECVGYGGVFVASLDLDIATYDLGYGDGLLRYCGVGDLHLANGQKVLGKMSMDSFSTIDAGSKVCVFDDANVWAEFFRTISYDILVKLSKDIPRKII